MRQDGIEAKTIIIFKRHLGSHMDRKNLEGFEPNADNWDQPSKETWLAQESWVEETVSMLHSSMTFGDGAWMEDSSAFC